MAEYRFQHFVPRTYLESWENNKHQLRVHEKDTDKYFYKATDSVLGKNDYYTLKAEDTLVLTDKDRQDIYGELLNYDIEFDGKKLITLEEIIFNFNRFDEWIIRSKDYFEVDVQSIKNEIGTKRILDIEKGWHQIEGDWKIIREEIVKTMEDKNYNLNIDVAERLIQYITSQKSRNDSKKEEYRELFDSIMGFFEKDMGKHDYNKILDEFAEAYFLKSIREYQNEEESHLMKEQDLMMNLHIVLYRSTGNKTFFTSDNPAFAIVDVNFYKGKYSGLYFPITPNILVALHKGETYRYTRRDMPINMIKRVNKRLSRTHVNFT